MHERRSITVFVYNGETYNDVKRMLNFNHICLDLTCFTSAAEITAK